MTIENSESKTTRVYGHVNLGFFVITSGLLASLIWITRNQFLRLFETLDAELPIVTKISLTETYAEIIPLIAIVGIAKGLIIKKPVVRMTTNMALILLEVLVFGYYMWGICLPWWIPSHVKL